MKRFLIWTVKVIFEAALETTYGVIAVLMLLGAFVKVLEFIERRSKKSK